MTDLLEAPNANGIAPPRSVIQAVARVMGALPAIGKDGKADPSQGGYRYRGIEQITASAQRLLAEHGVIFVPRVVNAEIVDLTVNNKPWTDTRLTVAYTVYGPDGDSIQVGPLLAIGRDNSDKGANKAMTQAFKQALLQVFCIADSKDDTDGSTHEADGPPEESPWRSLGYTTADHFRQVNDSLRAQFHNLPDDRVATVKAWLKDQGYDRAVPVAAHHSDAYRLVMEGQRARSEHAPKPTPATERLVHELREAVNAVPTQHRGDLAAALKSTFGYEKADQYDMASARAALAMAKEWRAKHAEAPKDRPLSPKIAAVCAYAVAQSFQRSDVATVASWLLDRPVTLADLTDDDATALESAVADLVSGDISITANGTVLEAK